jgi:3D (Asp-Asp-Asp) domain-containing protein
MSRRVVWLAVVVISSLLFFGCTSERELPSYEAPLARSEFMKVRTTAYNDHESDHLKYANASASGTALQSGQIRSAAADWSRWPAGTQFVIEATGQTYIVDDCGWDLAGRNTIDLYCPSRGEMNTWGVRRVTIHVVHWGDPWASYRILKPRTSYAHVRRMLDEIRRFYRENQVPQMPEPVPVKTETIPVKNETAPKNETVPLKPFLQANSGNGVNAHL